MRTAVIVFEAVAGSSHTIGSPHARTAARTPSARRCVASEDVVEALFVDQHRSASRRPNSISVAGVYGNSPMRFSRMIGAQSQKWRGEPPSLADQRRARG